MTTAEIETLANPGGAIIGSSDLNLKTILRRKVIPQFESDVGECAWRRVFTTLSFAAGDREKDLPTNFKKMLDGPSWYDADGLRWNMSYLGENVAAVLESENSTTAAAPSGFYLVRPATAPINLRRIRLNAITDRALTLQYGYISQIYFADLTTSVELDPFIPLDLQWALVEGLKIEVLADRMAIDDPRIAKAIADRQRYIDKAIEEREPAMRQATKRIKTGPI